MESRTKAIVSFAILVVLIFGLYFFSDWFSKTTGYVLGEDEKLKLAQCLNNEGAVFYVSSTCPKCVEQLGLFGDGAAEIVSVFECTDFETCPAKGGVPAWEIDDNFHYGVIDLNDLIELSECEVKS